MSALQGNSGLIRALALADAEAFGDWPALQRADEQTTAYWLELDYSDEAVQDWLHSRDWLPEWMVDNLLAEDTRPRLLTAPGGILLTLRGVNSAPGADPEHMVAVRLWLDQRRIVACRRRALASLADVAGAIVDGTEQAQPPALLCLLLERLLERAQHVAWSIEERLDELEEHFLQRRAERDAASSELAELRRQMIQLRRHLAPQREMLSQLATLRLPGFDEGERARLQNTADQAHRLIELLDTLRERALVTLEEHHTQLAQQHEQRLYLLSMITAIFLPLSFVTGLLGINVGGIPGADSGLGFVIVCAGLLLAALAIAWLLKRSRWF